MNEEEVQQRYAELELINQSFQQMQQQISLMNQQLQTLNKVNEALDAVKDVDGKSNVLVPLGGGVFVKSEIDKNSEFMVNVGSNVVVSKDYDNSKEIIKKQIEEVSQVMVTLEANMEELSSRAQGIQEELSKGISEISKEQ